MCLLEFIVGVPPRAKALGAQGAQGPAFPAAQFTFLPRAAEALARLAQLNLVIIVVSNQPGIAKRKFTTAHLDAMTRKMMALARSSGGRIDAVFYCRHHPQAFLPLYRKNCDCRKPKPGLLPEAIRDWDIDVGGTLAA